jgi:hypothetical protein
MSLRYQFVCVLLLCGVIASCSDATAPAGALTIVVSPDTLHLEGGRTSITYMLRAGARTAVWQVSQGLESEVTPGTWQAVDNSRYSYLQGSLGDASTTAANGDAIALGNMTASVDPGRYRLLYSFRVSAPNATQATGDVFVATSNAFVAVSP